MKFSEYPIVKLLLNVILGILLARANIFASSQWYWIVVFIILLLLMAWPKKYFFAYKHRHIAGFIISLLFISLGYSLYEYNFDYEKENHFSNHLEYSKSSQLRIIEAPLEKANSIKIIVEVEAIQTDSAIYNTLGKALLYLQKDSSANNLEYGDIIVFRDKIRATEPPQNPDQFDYKAYLHLNGIDYQSYARSDDWELMKKAGISPISLALHLRKKLIKILYNNNIKDDELSVAAGMLLGVRDMLSPELRDAYAGAGAMHILCVSGLHVGIIFLILSWLLSIIPLTRNSKIIKSIIILLIIWFYAMLTGFSPSVVRSATMFSFIIIGQSLKRHVNILGSISSSAFILIIFDPTLIFNLGFQLSYSAVISIVILQKPIANLWVPNNMIVDKLWQLVAVSIAAQIGTAPLSVYYFHQFPNFFILTNLIVIPAAYIIIMLGILVVAVSFIPYISALLGKLLSAFLSLVNFLITYIEQMAYAVTRNLYISSSIMLISILFIISLSIWLLTRKRFFVFVNLVLILLLFVVWNYNYDKGNEFVIYNTNKSTYMAIYSDNEAWVLCDSAIIKDPDIASFSVSGHEIRKNISKYNYMLIDSNLIIENSYFYVKYPYMKFGDTTIVFNDQNRDTCFPEANFYIYNSYKNRALKNYNQDLDWILTSNIPPWESKKLIPKLDSLGINSHQIKYDGAWVLKF